MGIKFDLDQVISQVGRDRGIDREVLVKALESAVLSAAKKHYGHSKNIEATYNDELSEIEVIEFRTVVDNVTDAETQMTQQDARVEFDPDCEVGDELGIKLDSEELGRIAAQTAKQVIIQKLRDAERDIIFSEYRDRKGEIVNGSVQRFERGNIIVNLGRTDAVLPEREQIPRERYGQNERIRALILEIDPVARGPQVLLTRSHPQFLKKLFELEVPEINEGIIELKAAAREPGERAKVAVYSSDPNIDPVGACVGIKGSRVQAVVNELRGERIDIVTWTADSPSFVARALAPAEVLRVVVDEDEHAMEVVVSDDQLSQAIGKRGQNVKLASKLTGWRIDVRSESVVEEESKKSMEVLEAIPGLRLGEAELLFQEGFRSIREVALASPGDLAGIDGLEEERAAELLTAARSLQVETEDELDVEVVRDTEDTLSSIDELFIKSAIKDQLKSKGIGSITALTECDEEDLVAQIGLSESEAASALEAARVFLSAQATEKQ